MTDIIVNPPSYVPGVTQTPNTLIGHWVLSASNHTGGRTEITWVRGTPTVLESWSFEDPFGPKSMVVRFPSITIFDRIGGGDLSWCAKDTNINLDFIGYLSPLYPFQGNSGSQYSWEGFMESFSFTSEGLQVTCKGAMYQMDNFLAKPEYLSRPLPYEVAIARQFNVTERPSMRLAKPTITFPSFAPKYQQPAKATAGYLIPVGVKIGSPWTGLLTRYSGNWEHVLTEYIQTILASMYTPYGRYTMDLMPGRVPAFFHRNFALAVEAGRTLLMDPGTPGVKMDVEQDYSQTMTTIFGQAKSFSGLSYSGQETVSDATFGVRSIYIPLAELRQAHLGYGKKDNWADSNLMVREQMLQLQDGLDADQAMDAAQNHLQHFSDPGITGQITLQSDLSYVTKIDSSSGYPIVTATEVMSRFHIRPGMTLFVSNLLGNIDGVLLHITAVECHENGDVVITVDSKNRDALTVFEVRARGRDSMSVQRQILAGTYTPPVSDQLVPWDYSHGSGFIPSAPHLSSLNLFIGMPNSSFFPWTDWIKSRPPSDKSWRNSYIHIGPRSSNADNNWATYVDAGFPTGMTPAGGGIPIKVSQAAQIRLIQICAVDYFGNQMKVPFHVSLYLNKTVNPTSTPQIVRANLLGTDGYASGQHYPFFNAAWEKYNVDGTQINTEQTTAHAQSGLVRGYGTRFVPAGYWPGSKPAGDQPTGMLVDEGTWNFDTGSLSDTNVLNVIGGPQPKYAGYLYMMIYCDAQLAQDVYFIGRMYRTEPQGT